MVSLDGLELRDFDFIDVGEVIQANGCIPVVIKSLIFPTSSKEARD
jgi:ethanolamine utilization protein EutA